MLVALACRTPNSSSISGSTGDKMALAMKFINQRNQIKRRKRRALPANA